MSLLEPPVALHEAARRRYLSYALSVIKSRALPDVRDGLKPVQRRILYAMYHNLHLTPDARYKKCAAIVGEVLGKYHPHGDSAVYEALVRMAQPFTLLHPLVDGQGNFGSVDGDSAAAYRYTEARLTPIAVELLSELKQRTVEMRPTFDAQNLEPVVMPAQFPQLLVNGSEGIAVGMATSIPPHNLREVIDACLLLLDTPEASLEAVCRKIKGPDFPTGGEIVTPPGELLEIYASGAGSVKVRGTWEPEQRGRKHFVVISSIPYAVVKARLVEEIGALIREKKIPQLTDVKDESTDVCRVVLELRSAADADAAMAFLLKHTRLQVNVHVNLTCLVPEGPDATKPERLDLRRMLRLWLDFRYETVRRRLEFELGELRKRIHVLEGFEKVFDLLDEAIVIIRASEGKRDAAERLMNRFGLDDEQAEAILELKLHKLARLEILAIREELAEKRAEAARIAAILDSRAEMWSVVREELQGIRKQYGETRRTGFGADSPAPAYQEDAYIVAEDVVVVVTRDGWVKRQGTVSELGKVRVRDGDAIGWAFRGSTRSTVAFFTSTGTAYTLRVDDLPATTGYGEPVQKFFDFADGERVVGVVSFDSRNLPAAETPAAPEDPPPPYVICVSRQGKGVRISLSLFAEPSKRTGRAVQKLEEREDATIAAYPSTGTEQLCLATTYGHVLTFPVAELGTVKAAGKGITAIKVDEKDAVFAAELSRARDEGPVVLTALGRQEVVSPRPYQGSRGAKGRQLFKRGFFARWQRPPELLLGKTTTEGEA